MLDNGSLLTASVTRSADLDWTKFGLLNSTGGGSCNLAFRRDSLLEALSVSLVSSLFPNALRK